MWLGDNNYFSIIITTFAGQKRDRMIKKWALVVLMQDDGKRVVTCESINSLPSLVVIPLLLIHSSCCHDEEEVDDVEKEEQE